MIKLNLPSKELLGLYFEKYIPVKYLIFAGLKNIIVLILKSDTDFTDLRHFSKENRDF